MTRLKETDIEHIESELAAYDRKLQSITGLPLSGVACRAIGRDVSEVAERISSCRVFAIPMTCGAGIITNFSKTLCAIARHLGFDAKVTKHTDSAGLGEAYENHADVILTADDNRFIAIHTGKRIVVDNVQATGKGFTAGLSLMAGGLRNRLLLVIGCGPVGRSAALAAAQMGAKVTLFDIDQVQCHNFAAGHPAYDFTISDSLDAALADHDLIVDATPAEDVIEISKIPSSAFIAAPGVPCGVSFPDRQKLSSRLLWDPLRIGVATMLLEAVLYE